jgi:uncharacterized protein YjbJ (UPF0337 family)
MNKDMAQGSWNEIKGKIKAQWGKFTDDDLETFKGNLDQLTGKLQKTYGYTREQAELEFKQFRSKLAGGIQPKE